MPSTVLTEQLNASKESSRKLRAEVDELLQRVSAQEASNARSRDQFSDELRGAHETIAELRSALRQNAERRKEDDDALVRHHRQKIAQLEKDNAVRR